MRSIRLTGVLLFVGGFFWQCVPSFKFEKSDRMIKESIDTLNVRVDWFSYSSAWGVYPDYITASNGAMEETLCVSTNIADISFYKEGLVVGFYESPRLYQNIISLPEKKNGFSGKSRYKLYV